LIQKAKALGINLETESKTIPEMQKFMSQSNPGRANIIKENAEADKKIKGKYLPKEFME